MCLITEVGGRPPHVEVDSNERKRAVMIVPVPSDVFAVHEPHIRVKNERRLRRRRNTSARPAAENLRRAEDAIKVGNGRKFGRGSRKIHMKNMAVAEKIQAARNRIGQRMFRGGVKIGGIASPAASVAPA